jgi:hypothetical protein
MAAFPLEAVSQFRQASTKTLQSIAHLQTDLLECEQTADIKTTQHGLTQLQTSIATVNDVIENVNSANVTRTSFAPVDIRSEIKPELENILGFIENVRGLLNPPQVNRMRESNVIRFNEAAQELDAAAKNLVAGLRSKVMIRPGLGLDLPEVEDPPAPAPSPPPISDSAGFEQQRTSAESRSDASDPKQKSGGWFHDHELAIHSNARAYSWRQRSIEA